MFLHNITALYFIFSMNLVFFYEIFYNDVTTLLRRHSFLDRSWWKLHSIYKIRNKRHFVHENFSIFVIFIEKITIYYENHVHSAVTLHLSPIPFGLPIRLGYVRDTSFPYLTILFQHKKIVFTKNVENPAGLIPIPGNNGSLLDILVIFSEDILIWS